MRAWWNSRDGWLWLGTLVIITIFAVALARQ